MQASTLLALFAAIALVAAPGGYASEFSGTPLSAASRVVLCAIVAAGLVCGFWTSRRRVGLWLPAALVVLAIAKVWLGSADEPTGWRGTYEYVDQKGAERAARFHWRFAVHDHRIDRRVAFDRDTFDLHFLNSIPHFGAPPYSTKIRQYEFPLRVQWDGYVTREAPGPIGIAAKANGDVAVEVDGQPVLTPGPDATVQLGAGRHHLAVRYDKPAMTWPQVQVSFEEGATGGALYVSPVDGGTTSRWLGLLTTSVVVAGLLLLGSVLLFCYAGAAVALKAPAGARLVLAVATAVIAFWTAHLAVGTLGHTAFLHGGGDPLGYASDARAILHDGPLLLQGQPLGKAAPFYFYPLYPYALAATHAVVGEDVSAIFLLNGLSLMCLPLLFWHLGWKRLEWVASVVAGAALLLFVGRYCWPIAAFEEPSFTDILFLPVAFAALVALHRAFDAPAPRSLLLAGVLLALGSANRPSFLMLVGCAPVGLFVAQRQRTRAARAVSSAWLLAGVFLGLLPFTLRNLVASGRFVVLVNSWIQIPYFLIPPEVAERPRGAPTLMQALAMAKDIWLRDPLGTAWVEVRKVVFTLGYGGRGIAPADASPSNSLSVMTPLFACALWLGRVPRTLAIVLTTFAISHLMGMVLAAPWSFGLKTILPIHAAFLCGAVFLLQPMGFGDSADPPQP